MPIVWRSSTLQHSEHFQDSVLDRYAGLRRCRRDRTWTRSCQTRTPSIFFLLVREIGGVRPHPPNPPWLHAWKWREQASTTCRFARYPLASEAGEESSFNSETFMHYKSSPVLCWGLGCSSIAITWEKKALGCHKFYSLIASIGWFPQA